MTGDFQSAPLNPSSALPTTNFRHMARKLWTGRLNRHSLIGPHRIHDGISSLLPSLAPSDFGIPFPVYLGAVDEVRVLDVTGVFTMQDADRQEIEILVIDQGVNLSVRSLRPHAAAVIPSKIAAGALSGLPCDELGGEIRRVPEPGIPRLPLDLIEKLPKVDQNTVLLTVRRSGVSVTVPVNLGVDILPIAKIDCATCRHVASIDVELNLIEGDLNVKINLPLTFEINSIRFRLMKNIRFYEEFVNKRKGESEGNVVALLVDDNGSPSFNPGGAMECISGIFIWPNSPVTSTAVSHEHLQKHCKRVSEARAREIHPQLFKRLDAKE
jgi:hypothetical protein